MLQTGGTKTYCFCSFLIILHSKLYLASTEDGFCEKTDDGVSCDNKDDVRLTRLKSDQVGEVKDIVVDGDRTLQIRTVNIKPLIFEIEDFLTEKECEHFIDEANDIGMVASYTAKQDKHAPITLVDLNHDQKLDLTEMKLTLENGYDVYLEDEDLIQMYTTLQLDTNKDTSISRKELSAVTPREIEKYIAQLLTSHPEKHSRFSRQAWLYPDQSEDDVFKRVQKRVSDVVKLPLGLIRLSDFQVVNYGKDGHYNAHLDSSHLDTKVPCCDRNKSQKCRLCRYMTILFYLNNVEEGGETAFPFANKDSLNQTSAHLERVHHLFKNCEDAKVRVAAKKGKAIFWYNHFIREDNGWIGDVDEYTLHGGCPVQRGEKWIANFWIKTSDNKEKDMQKMQKMS